MCASSRTIRIPKRAAPKGDAKEQGRFSHMHGRRRVLSPNAAKSSLTGPKSTQGSPKTWWTADGPKRNGLLSSGTARHAKKSAPPAVPGVLPNEHYGTNITSIAAFLRCICLSYEKIQNVLHTLYGAYISESALIRLCDASATKMTPVYDDILEGIRRSESVGGDETGWFLNGAGHWGLDACDQILGVLPHSVDSIRRCR